MPASAARRNVLPSHAAAEVNLVQPGTKSGRWFSSAIFEKRRECMTYVWVTHSLYYFLFISRLNRIAALLARRLRFAAAITDYHARLAAAGWLDLCRLDPPLSGQLPLPGAQHKPIGLWGQRHKRYLQEHTSLPLFILRTQKGFWPVVFWNQPTIANPLKLSSALL